jgi:hypothetical protein
MTKRLAVELNNKGTHLSKLEMCFRNTHTSTQGPTPYQGGCVSKKVGLPTLLA